MRKGDVMSNIIIWSVIVAVALILAAWLVPSAQKSIFDTGSVWFDIEQISSSVNVACKSDSFVRTYNPRTEQGFLNASQYQLCISDGQYTGCFNTTCEQQPTSISLEDISEIRIIYTGDQVVFQGRI